MNIKKPLFWENKNLTALLLTPLSIIALITNFLKTLLPKKIMKLKLYV